MVSHAKTILLFRTPLPFFQSSLRGTGGGSGSSLSRADAENTPMTMQHGGHAMESGGPQPSSRTKVGARVFPLVVDGIRKSVPPRVKALYRVNSEF